MADWVGDEVVGITDNFAAHIHCQPAAVGSSAFQLPDFLPTAAGWQWMS